MIKKSAIYIITILLIFTLNVKAQFSNINWNVVPDSIVLTPIKFQSEGTFTFRYTSGASPIQLAGKFTIFPKDKILYYNNGENLIKFSNYSDVIGLNLNSYKYFSNDDLNSRDFYDSLLQGYRKNLFKVVDLAEIEIQISKKNKFEIIDNDLKVKRPFVLKGKLCTIELEQVTILTEEGDLFTIYDGDFNYLKLGQTKVFECRDLYKYIFERYVDKLNEVIANWKKNNSTRSIDFFIENYGPFDFQYDLPFNKKLFVWNKKNIKYNISLNSTTYSKSLNRGTFYRNQNISPLFYYYNQANSRYIPSYISTNNNLVGTGNTISSNTTQSIQNGEVTSNEESIIMSLIFDSSGKLIESYQERVFATPEYGRIFRFINLVQE
jgi:hypothetical protein